MALTEVASTSAGVPPAADGEGKRSHLKVIDLIWIAGLSLGLPFMVGLIYGLYLTSQGYTAAGVDNHFELPEVKQAASIVGLALLTFVPLLLVCAFAWRRKVALADLGLRISDRWYFFYALVGLGLLSAVGYSLTPFLDEVELVRLSQANDDLFLQPGPVFILTMVFAIVLVPISEEFFFRGAVFNALVQHMPAYVAAVVGSGLFAVVHTQYLLLGGQAAAFGLFQIFLLGIVLSWLFIKSRSVWPPIFLHILNNAFAFLSLI